MIDITLRGLNAAQMAALAAVLAKHGYATTAEGDPRFSGNSQIDALLNQVLPKTAESTPAQPDYAGSLAASVFGKSGDAVSPNAPTEVYAPSGAGATAAPLTKTPPVQPAVGGTPAGAEVDAEGYPWDGRIHSASKAILAKEKTWKLIRNIDKNLVAQVRAEWDAKRGNVGAAVVQTVPAFNPAATAPVTRFNDQPVTQQPAQVAPYTPPAQSYAPPPLDYQTLSAKITGAIATQRIAAPVVAGLLNHNGVQDLPSLANFPNLWLHISTELDRLTGGV